MSDPFLDRPADWIDAALGNRSEEEKRRVEITPQMLRAGVLAASIATFDSEDDWATSVIAIYSAMSAA